MTFGAGARAAGAAAGVARPKRKATKKQRNIRSASNAYTRAQNSRVNAEGRINESRVDAQRRISATRAENYVAAREAAQNLYAERDKRKSIHRNVKRSAVGLAEQKSLVNAAGSLASTRPGTNPLLLIIFTWAGIVLLYVLISTPGSENTSQFMTSMRNWIRLIYSHAPLFTANIIDE